MCLGRGIVFLYLSPPHQVVEYGKCHVWAQCTGAIAQQQCRVHGLAYFAALDYESCLNTFPDTYEVMVYGTHSQQRGNCRMPVVDITVAEDDVVHTIIYTLLCIMTEVVECPSQSLLTTFALEQHG